jgi:hypothetical protein
MNSYFKIIVFLSYKNTIWLTRWSDETLIEINFPQATITPSGTYTAINGSVYPSLNGNKAWVTYKSRAKQIKLAVVHNCIQNRVLNPSILTCAYVLIFSWIFKRKYCTHFRICIIKWALCRLVITSISLLKPPAAIVPACHYSKTGTVWFSWIRRRNFNMIR